MPNEQVRNCFTCNSYWHSECANPCSDLCSWMPVVRESPFKKVMDEIKVTRVPNSNLDELLKTFPNNETRATDFDAWRISTLLKS